MPWRGFASKVWPFLKEWGGTMSGGLSIPFALLALLFNMPARPLFALLAYVALWVMVFSQRATISKLQSQIKEPKKQNIAIYDRFDELVKRGDTMMERFRQRTPPYPTEAEFRQWGNEVVGVAETCATIEERNRLRDQSVSEIGDVEIMDIYMYVEKENWPIAEKLFAKIKIARGIMDRLRKNG